MSREKERNIGARVELVSSANGFRTSQLYDLIERADRQNPFIPTGKTLVIAERSQEQLEEIVGKIAREFLPHNIMTAEHIMQDHFEVADGLVVTHYNLLDGSVVMLKARIKHPCSLAEKVARKTARYGRLGEFSDMHKINIHDLYGIEIVTKLPRDVKPVVDKLSRLPYLNVMKEDVLSKKSGYRSTHLDVEYSNGNPALRGLFVEIKVNDVENHFKHDADPAQSHSLVYGPAKLSMPHNIGNGHLITVGNSVDLEGQNVVELEECRVAQISNPFMGNYTLVVPREGVLE